MARGTVRGLKRFGATSVEDKTRDVFEFQESDEEVVNEEEIESESSETVEVDYSSRQDDVVCTALHRKMPLGTPQ